jgi:hypothetical protein
MICIRKQTLGTEEEYNWQEPRISRSERDHVEQILPHRLHDFNVCLPCKGKDSLARARTLMSVSLQGQGLSSLFFDLRPAYTEVLITLWTQLSVC